jgi:predicted ATP-binding protein involved in virulence
MLTSLRVTGFRNFSSLALEGLTRVNLLVGENNAGKTSVLETLEMSVPPLQPDTETYPVSDLDRQHLFHGREISPGTSFEIRGESSQGPLGVTCTAVIESQDSARLRQLDLPMAEQEDG